MQTPNLKNLPSTSSLLVRTNESGAAANAAPAKQRRTWDMQVRFLRVVTFSLWLFVRLLFWHWLVQRYMPDYVERTSLKRWMGYARSFRDFAIEMGGVMIKLGQFISTRADILPQEIIDELAALRDEVPGVPTSEIRAIIESQLGPIDERYSWFDDKPVAAASLGQVHRARLLNGDRVVVKVQRPGIDAVCRTDLDALRVVGKTAMKFKFISRRADTVALMEEFGRVLMEELSYRHESRNAARFAEMFREDMGVYIPQIYNEHSTDRILTIEDVTTIKINDYAALEAAGISRKAVAKRLMDTYLRQVFEEHFFHADPHPGNLFVYPLPADGASYNGGGRPFYLIFIDFGMTGVLTPNIVSGLINTLGAVVTRDSKKLISSYQELGFLLPGADTERLEEATKLVFDQVWGMDMSQMSNVGYEQMAEIGTEFSDLLFDMPFQMPQDFVYLGRTVSILSGMCTSLDPTFNPWQELQPYTQKMITQSLTTSTNGSPSLLQTLMGGGGAQTLMGIGQSLLGLGNNSADAVLARIERGDIKLTVAPDAKYKRQLDRIESQGRKTVRAVIGGSVLIAATLLYTNGDLAPALVGWLASGWVLLGSLFGGE